MHVLTVIGPNLSGIGTRKMIAAGWLPNTDANLRDWIEHTQKVKPDVLMKLPIPVSDDEGDGADRLPSHHALTPGRGY